MKKYAKILVAVSLMLLVGTGSFIWVNGNFNNIINKSSEKKELSQIFKKEEIKDKKAKIVFQKMHEMANTKIVAVDGLVWGEMEPTEESVNELIKEVSSSNYEDKEQLLQILNRWKNGDFSNCVDDHNFLWKKLGGQVGKASKLRQKQNSI